MLKKLDNFEENLVISGGLHVRSYGKTDYQQHASYDVDHITKYLNISATQIQLPTTMFIYFGALGQR